MFLLITSLLKNLVCLILLLSQELLRYLLGFWWLLICLIGKCSLSDTGEFPVDIWFSSVLLDNVNGVRYVLRGLMSCLFPHGWKSWNLSICLVFIKMYTEMYHLHYPLFHSYYDIIFIILSCLNKSIKAQQWFLWLRIWKLLYYINIHTYKKSSPSVVWVLGVFWKADYSVVIA